VLSDENVLRSVAVSWYLNQNKSLTGQDKEFVKNARIFIDHEQPLIPVSRLKLTTYLNLLYYLKMTNFFLIFKILTIKEDDIKKQEAKLKELRHKLCAARDDYESVDTKRGLPATKRLKVEPAVVSETKVEETEEEEMVKVELPDEVKEEPKSEIKSDLEATDAALPVTA
jgi:hypothetical protein